MGSLHEEELKIISKCSIKTYLGVSATSSSATLSHADLLKHRGLN